MSAPTPTSPPTASTATTATPTPTCPTPPTPTPTAPAATTTPATTTTPTAMSRAHRAYVIAMCAIIGGAFAYAACDWGRWPHFIYLPLSERVVRGPTTAVALHYLGLVAWGTGGACVGAMLGAIACRIAPRTWPPRLYTLLGAWAITAIALAGGYFTWSLWPW
jgi:hypothetical protein